MALVGEDLFVSLKPDSANASTTYDVFTSSDKRLAYAIAAKWANGDPEKEAQLQHLWVNHPKRQQVTAAAAQVADLENTLLRTLEKYDSQKKEKTIVISHASTREIQHLGDIINLKFAPTSHLFEDTSDNTFETFTWGQNECEGTNHAVAHLLEQLKKFGLDELLFGEEETWNAIRRGYHLLNVSNEHNFLDYENDKIKIHGSTDAAIVCYGMQLGKVQQLCSIFEFKTTIPPSTTDIPNQLIVEAISAQINSNQLVLSIETDLVSNHAFGVEFRVDGKNITLVPIKFHSLVAMAQHVAKFLNENCEPNGVQSNKRNHSTSESGDSNDDDNSDETGGGRGDGASGGGGGKKRAKSMMVEAFHSTIRGDITLAHEHFNDHIGDTEPLSKERATMVKHLFESYGYTIPSYQFGVPLH